MDAEREGRVLPDCRRAGVQDLEALLDIETCCFSSDRISRRQMRYLLTRAQGRLWVATYPTQVVGYALCLTPKLPRAARLYSLAVLPEWQGYGIATSLLVALFEQLVESGYERCSLEVRLSQMATQHLYQSLGFVPGEVLPSYYQDGEDGLRMRAQLTDR